MVVQSDIGWNYKETLISSPTSTFAEWLTINIQHDPLAHSGGNLISCNAKKCPHVLPPDFMQHEKFASGFLHCKRKLTPARHATYE